MTILPFYLFDFCFAFGVFGLFLFQLVEIVLEFVLFESCTF